MVIRQQYLKQMPFVLAAPDHGKLRITAVSALAQAKGIENGMTAADAKVILPVVQVIDDQPELTAQLLKKLCLWCIRYTPAAAIDIPDGLMLDVSGCTHLWGGEEAYLREIIHKLKGFGYHIRAAMAGTIGAAWAIARYGHVKAIIQKEEQLEALMQLPPAALRLDIQIQERLHKLGLYQIGSFIKMPRSVLRRRFGVALLQRMDQALGYEAEILQPLIPVEPYQERLPCLEPIKTRAGIEIALQRSLEQLCHRLVKDGKGLRVVALQCYRVDDNMQSVQISTNHASHNSAHLFKLFELKIGTIEPAWGIELFILQATKVEDIRPVQETCWAANSSLESREVAELLDGFQSRFGDHIVHRYLPDEHHLPEQSIKLAHALSDNPATAWRTDKLRPIRLLKQPERIEVAAPIPDYPPMNFRYQNKLHKVKKADACERIEAAWWIQNGLHRDYYIVEDEEGKRYWLFRLGHYDENVQPAWFLHGFFA